MSPHPGPEDMPYLRASFAELPALCHAHGRDPGEVRAALDDGRLPGPAYVLADGTALVAPDHFALAEAAGGDERLPAWFAETFARAAAGGPEAEELGQAWEDYLSGGYAVCLHSVTPHTIVRKSVLMRTIEDLLAAPRDDAGWRGDLRHAVDALDVLERPFAAVDRAAGPVSRDRLITAVRAAFPAAWDAA